MLMILLTFFQTAFVQNKCKAYNLLQENEFGY